MTTGGLGRLFVNLLLLLSFRRGLGLSFLGSLDVLWGLAVGLGEELTRKAGESVSVD